MSQANSNVVPDFLSAETPQGLRRLMRLNNAKRGCWHRYDILFVKDRWVAWYYPAVATQQELSSANQEMVNELKSGGNS